MYLHDINYLLRQIFIIGNIYQLTCLPMIEARKALLIHGQVHLSLNNHRFLLKRSGAQYYLNRTISYSSIKQCAPGLVPPLSLLSPSSLHHKVIQDLWTKTGYNYMSYLSSTFKLTVSCYWKTPIMFNFVISIQLEIPCLVRNDKCLNTFKKLYWKQYSKIKLQFKYKWISTLGRTPALHILSAQVPAGPPETVSRNI